MMKGESLWPRVAGLPLVIEACEYERLRAVLAYEFQRITTHVRLVGMRGRELNRRWLFRRKSLSSRSRRHRLESPGAAGRAGPRYRPTSSILAAPAAGVNTLV